MDGANQAGRKAGAKESGSTMTPEERRIMWEKLKQQSPIIAELLKKSREWWPNFKLKEIELKQEEVK